MATLVYLHKMKASVGCVHFRVGYHRLWSRLHLGMYTKTFVIPAEAFVAYDASCVDGEQVLQLDTR